MSNKGKIGGNALAILMLISMLSIANFQTMHVDANGPLEPHAANAMWIEPSLLEFNTAEHPPGTRFTIVVWENIATDNMWAWQAKLLFDPEYIQVAGVGYTAGTMSEWATYCQIGPVVSPSPVIDNVAGYVMGGETLVTPGDFVPAGTVASLMWVEFEIVKAPGVGQVEFRIVFYLPDTFMLDNDLNSISFHIPSVATFRYVCRPIKICENKEIIIVAESQFCHENDNVTVTVHVAPPKCGVELLVFENLEGVPGALLTTYVEIHNTGTIVDNFMLSIIPNGWGENVWIEPAVVENVPPGFGGWATLYVRIPDNATVCENKFIIIVAESQFCHENDNDTVVVHVVEEACGVSVGVWPDWSEGAPGTLLTFSVYIYNAGTVLDNFDLSVIPNGWGDNVWIEPAVVENVPPGWYEYATLYVRIPDNAMICENKEIIIVAESQFCYENDNDTVVVHVVEEACGVSVGAYPYLDEGPPGTSLTFSVYIYNAGTVLDNFDLSVIPNGWGDNVWIEPAVVESVPPGWYEYATLYVRIPDNATICENKYITIVAESQFCHENDNVTVTVHVAAPQCGVYIYAWPDYKEGVPGTLLTFDIEVYNAGNITDNFDLSVIPNGWGDNVWIEPAVVENIPPGGYGLATLYVRVPIVRDVDVSISPSYRSGPPCTTLTYAVTVQNTGNVSDTYYLTVSENDNWGATLDENLFENVLPGENRQTWLRVHIPENTPSCTSITITVTAVGTGVQDNSQCIAHATVGRVFLYDENDNLVGTFDEIQPAVDNAQTGYRIEVYPGTYLPFKVENMDNLDIIAPLGGVTVGENVVTYMMQYDNENYPLWSINLVINSENINIEGIDVDGVGVEPLVENFWFNGITYFNSSGRVAGGSVRNVLGEGVCAAQYELSPTVEISGMTIENFMMGIYIQNDNVRIENCLIDGSARIETTGSMGILAIDGASVTIENSKIVNCRVTAMGPRMLAFGVLIGIPGIMENMWMIENERPSWAEIKGSHISRNNLGIFIDNDGDAMINNNNICCNDVGMIVVDGRAENVNAENNWWGHVSGPWEPLGNPGGLGNLIMGFATIPENMEPPELIANVDYEPWLLESLGLLAADNILPVIENALAIPSMISLFGIVEMPFSAGPGKTTFVVDAYDENGITVVVVNLKALVLQMVPEDVLVREGMENVWQEWLDNLENVRMWYEEPCTVWTYRFSLEEIWGRLLELLDYSLDQIIGVLRFGEFSIPVKAIDCAGNESYENVELTIVHMLLPLRQGWNLRSTPVLLEDERWEDVYSLGDGLEFDVAVRYDAAEREWVQLTDDCRLKPLEGIYIHMSEADQLALIFENSPTQAPPARQLYAGWNLIGLAVKPWDPWMPADQALATVYNDPDNYWGYVQVVSPFQSLERTERFYYENCELGEYHKHFHQDQWVFVRDRWEGQHMMIGGGYWVYMDNPDEFAGFSTTPVPWVQPPRGLHQVDFQWYEVTKGEADIWDAEDDDSFPYDLPWSFPFAGKQIVRIGVASNGYIELLEAGEEPASLDTYDWSDYDYVSYFWETYENSDFIFAWMDDLSSYYFGYYAAKYVPEMDVVVIQWTTETYYDEGYNLLNSFQLWLSPDGSIKWNFNYFNYENYDYDLYSGIYDGTSHTGLDIGYAISTQQSWKFYGEYLPEFGEPKP
jgi:uncharacterized membrane protein